MCYNKSMRAVETIKSIEDPDKSNGSSKNEPTNGPYRPDTFFARLRRLEHRVSFLEQQLSTARRDINRIDRKQYREMPPSVASPSEGVVDPNNIRGLYGIGE